MGAHTGKAGSHGIPHLGTPMLALTATSMGIGALLGWAVLGPMAKALGWAPGPVMNSITGARGWILWVALAMMMGEGLTSLGLITWTTWYAGPGSWVFQSILLQHWPQVKISMLCPGVFAVSRDIFKAFLTSMIACLLSSYPPYQP